MLPLSFVRFRFRSLTTQPLFLPFLLFPVSASQWLPRFSLSAFASLPLPLLFRLISHASFPVLLYLASCLFPFVLPCFAPTAVPQVLPFQISPPGPVPDFHFLSSASVLASHYSASASSVPSFPRLRLTVAISVRPLRFRFLALSPSVPPGFPCFPSGSSVLGFLLVSFHPSQFRSRSCSTGACLPLHFVSSASLSAFTLLFCFLSSASFPVLTTQPLPFPFPSSLFSLARVLQVPVYPLPFLPVSMHSVPLWYSALLQFFSTFPASLHSSYRSL